MNDIKLPIKMETERLLFFKPTLDLAHNLYGALVDGYDDYIKWLGYSKLTPTLNSVKKEILQHLTEFNNLHFIRYTVVEKSTGIVLGRSAFPSSQLDWHRKEFGVSYFIRRSKRSMGYATESCYVMTKLAFDLFDAQKIKIYCDDENTASNKVAEKLNFEIAYIDKHWVRLNLEPGVLVVYQIRDQGKLSMQNTVNYYY